MEPGSIENHAYMSLNNGREIYREDGNNEEDEGDSSKLEYGENAESIKDQELYDTESDDLNTVNDKTSNNEGDLEDEATDTDTDTSDEDTSSDGGVPLP